MKTTLSRRRDRNAPTESWHVYFGDVRVGWIGLRAGVPTHTAPWGWSCGFYPGSEPGEHRTGTGIDFEEARAGFEAAWKVFSAARTERDFERWRESRDFTAWKYAMRDANLKLPTELTGGLARCFCGEPIDDASIRDHIRSRHAGRE